MENENFWSALESSETKTEEASEDKFQSFEDFLDAISKILK
jgi:hypothetical protein